MIAFLSYMYFDIYQNNNALAVQLVTVDGEPYATISTNLPESASLSPTEFFLKDWSENEPIADALIQKGIIKPTGKQASSGFVTAKSYTVVSDYLEEGWGKNLAAGAMMGAASMMPMNVQAQNTGVDKNKIDEVKDKYIIKGETIDYALCFFPSDEIYHFINVNETLQDLVSYARKNRVVLVSPATIQPTLYTLKSLMIEYKRSQQLLEVNKLLVSLENEFRLLDERYTGFMATFDALINKRGPLDITMKKLDNNFNQIKHNSESEEE